ncbi:MAG: chemotaxis protein CheW [Gammaproteobacteria bacterium]|nr:chemotaxis protein CheW [Gammaproteobacteria bacterium]
MTEHNKHHVSKTEVYLEFKVGPLHFCVPVHEVEAIRSPAEMKVMPVSGTVMACSFNHQGRSVTVIDMHSKFGLPFSANKNRTHIILATVENELKGFWVDRAINVMPLSRFEKDNSGARPLSSAFFNFLLRDREIVLQTSFTRLFQCQASDLSWVAGDKAKEEVQPDKRLEPVTNEDSDSSINAEITRSETVSKVPQPQLAFLRNKNKKNNKASAANKKTAGEVGKNKPASVISLAAISAHANSKNRKKPDIAVPVDSATTVLTTRSYNNRVVSISAHKNKIVNRTGHNLNNKPDNKSEGELKSKPENKKHTLLFLVMAMLAIVALGWSIGYLMSVSLSTRIENTHSSLPGSNPTFYISAFLPIESNR